MKAAGSSETVNSYQNTWQHIPGDIVLHILFFIPSSIPFTGSNSTASDCVGPECLQANLCHGFDGLTVLECSVAK